MKNCGPAETLFISVSPLCSNEFNISVLKVLFAQRLNRHIVHIRHISCMYACVVDPKIMSDNRNMCYAVLQMKSRLQVFEVEEEQVSLLD
jgi:hypothetical protein